MPSKPFFVFSQFHSGSKMLCSLLESHPDIVCPHESLLTIDGVAPDFNRVFAKLRGQQPFNTYYGLHAQYPNVTHDMLHASIPKILLYREDEIKGALSQYVHSIRRVNRQFELDPAIVQNRAEQRYARTAEMAEHCTMTVSYEELTGGGANISRLNPDLGNRILTHIGAEPAILTTQIRKNTQMLPKNLDECYGRTS